MAGSNGFVVNGYMTEAYRENLVEQAKTRSLAELIDLYSNLIQDSTPCRNEFKYIMQLKIEMERTAALEDVQDLIDQNDELVVCVETLQDHLKLARKERRAALIDLANATES